MMSGCSGPRARTHASGLASERRLAEHSGPPQTVDPAEGVEFAATLGRDTASELEWTLRCGKCGEIYVEAAWVNLVVSMRIEPAEVRRHVVHWPDELCVEVRRCAACGHRLVAKRNV